MNEREINAWIMRETGSTFRQIGEGLSVGPSRARQLSERGRRCMERARRHLPANVAPLNATFEQVVSAIRAGRIDYLEGEVRRINAQNARLERKLEERE